MNEAGVKNFDQENVAGAGVAEKIYGKTKEWGAAMKKAAVMFKENPELQKQAITTVAGSLASIAGVKSFYDVPEYLRERFMVRGVFGKGKGLEGSVEDLLAKSWQMRQDTGHEPEAEYDTEEHTEVRQAIADLDKRLMLTREGGQKGSEQRNLVAKLLKENRLAEKNNREERKEKITEVLDNYTTTKITGIQAARESLNTFLSASGAMALRGVSYGILDGAERYMRLNKEARVKAGGREQAEQVNFLKDVVAGGFKETWDELRLKDESGKKTGLRKGLDFIRAGGKVFRYLGLGYTGLAHPGRMGESMENLLNGLQGKTSFSGMGKNFVGNIERTYESYKSLPGRAGAWAKAEGKAGLAAVGEILSGRSAEGGQSIAKGAAAVAQYFVGTPEAAGQSPGQTGAQPPDGESSAGVAPPAAHGQTENAVTLISERQRRDPFDRKSVLRQAESQVAEQTADAKIRPALHEKGSETEAKIPQPPLLSRWQSPLLPLSGGNIERGLKNNFTLELGKEVVPAQLERVFHMMAVDAMKDPVGEDQVFGQEQAAKSLNVAANLTRLAQSKNVPGVEARELAEIFSWDGKKRSLAIKDYEKFNELVKKLHERADQLWVEGKLTAKGAAAEYIGDIKKATWGKIIKSYGLKEVEGHQGVPPEQIADFKKFEHEAVAPAEERTASAAIEEGEAEPEQEQPEPDANEKLAAEQKPPPAEFADKPKDEVAPEQATATKPKAEAKQGFDYADYLKKNNWTQVELKDRNNKISGSSWRKEIMLDEFMSAGKLSGKYSSEKFLLMAVDNNNDGEADQAEIFHGGDGEIMLNYNSAQIEFILHEKNTERVCSRFDNLAEKIIIGRLQEFEKITEQKVEIDQAERFGIKVFDQDGLSAHDTAKLEFLKDSRLTGLNDDAIKARFKIYDSAADLGLDLKQIDSHYAAIKDIQDAGLSARLIKVWAEPSEQNFRKLLDLLKYTDELDNFRSFNLKKDNDGNLIIDYVTKGKQSALQINNKISLTMLSDGKALVVAPDSKPPVKFENIADLRKVLLAPAEMVKTEPGGEVEADKPITIISADGEAESGQGITIIKEKKN